MVDETGDVLFTVVNMARRANVDPELALRRTTQKFVARVERAHELAAAGGEDWTRLALDEQDRYYEIAKSQESGRDRNAMKKGSHPELIGEGAREE